MRHGSLSSTRFSKAVIVHANFAQFKGGQVVEHPCVKSRMIVWCKAGTGSISTGNVTYSMEAGRCLFLPWGHQIHYQASREDPFLLGGVHLIPHHDFQQAIAFTVAHDEQHPLAQAPFRRDIEIPEISESNFGLLTAHAPLTYLLEYIVRLFVKSSPKEWIARQLAQQLLSELADFEQRREMENQGIPLELERMKQYIDFHLHQPLSLRDLVEFSHLSARTVGRMFRQHLHTTPVTWITRMKIERAKILLRTRRISVAAVGEQVGIPDPYYFSKCFKKETCLSPQRYRDQTVWI